MVKFKVVNYYHYQVINTLGIDHIITILLIKQLQFNYLQHRKVYQAQNLQVLKIICVHIILFIIYLSKEWTTHTSKKLFYIYVH